MTYLLLAILCSAAIAIIFKYSETNGMNRYAVTTSNYFIATLVSGVLSIREGLFQFNFKTGFMDLFHEAEGVLIKGEEFTYDSSHIWALVVGIIAGVFFFLSFMYYQKSVKEDGVGLAGTFSKMGILLPMVFSIILWNELPTVLQWFGIILSIVSILMVNLNLNKNFLESIRVPLILLFLFGGMAEFSNKIFQKYALIDIKSLFLFFIFSTAFGISLFFTLGRSKKVVVRDIITGLLVGIPNLFSSFFLILALNTLKTSVVFPLYSAGTIVMISIVGFLFFKEKLSRKETLSILLTVFALALVNL